MTPIDRAKIKHWNDLVNQANHVLKLWLSFYEGLHPKGGFDGYVVDDAYLAEMDTYLGEALLSHLHAEFPRPFKDVKTYTDLLSTNIPRDVISKLRLVAQRRTFDDTFCHICKSWQRTTSANSRLLTKPLIDDYLESLKNEGRSNNTISLYNPLLRRLEKEHEYLPTKPETLVEFLSQFKHDTTRSDYYKVLRWFYKWANKRHSISNPTDQMRAPIVKRKVVPSLSGGETEKLVRQPYNKRDYAIIITLVGCGLRMSELVNLKFIDILDNTLIIRDAKTGSREVPIIPHIRDALLDLKDSHNTSDPVFWGSHPTQPLKQAGIAGVVKKAFQKAGIKGKRPSPHTLRHTFARNWINQGGDLATLQRILGHENLATTQRYLNFSPEDLVDNNQKHNLLSRILDQRLSTTDDRLSLLDHHISQW